MESQPELPVPDMKDVGPEQDSASSDTSPSPTTVQTEEAQAKLAEKEESIRQACNLRDFDALVAHATSEGGFLRDDIRRLAWPVLLQSDRDPDLAAWGDLPPHADEDQIQLDVNRSFVYYPDCSDAELLLKKKELSDLINQVLRTYPMLCYFQGYHDIVQVLLLVLGGQRAAPAVTRLSLLRIRDYMLPSLSPTLKHLQLIPDIIKKADPALRSHLEGIRPFFAIAATLTLYAHDIEEYSDIARLFDFLLAKEPVVSIYLFVAIILSRKKELLEIPKDEPEMLHFTLSKLPCPLDLEALISRAVRLFDDYPPESLSSRAWKNLPQSSVLKTSRDLANQTTDEAVVLFQQQVRQLHNEERREKAIGFLWYHRRTIGSVAVAILIGAMSVWIRKKGLDTPIWSYLHRFKAAFQARGYL
ncbi:GTPase-activating protein gyp8 [Aspergillus melleus]|uniref:GTPase-activating protein gyp8 n=1 Tax=Aspergillus melleus TaxID=138277 RepID=A0ACC3BET3_9EURO|nr:GTPase-activating protein gyp8 [Aspergillus melleus]